MNVSPTVVVWMNGGGSTEEIALRNVGRYLETDRLPDGAMLKACREGRTER